MPGASRKGAPRRGRGRRPKDAEQIAHERMEILVKEAEAAVRAGRGDRARRYVDLARKIGMRHNVPMAREWKRWVCAGCGTFLLPGRNASVRTRPGHTVVRCLECGAVKRQSHGAGRRPHATSP
jgi:ribonuclease P protein subunit RPR2